jgi:hypothetical protein
MEAGRYSCSMPIPSKFHFMERLGFVGKSLLKEVVLMVMVMGSTSAKRVHGSLS